MANKTVAVLLQAITAGYNRNMLQAASATLAVDAAATKANRGTAGLAGGLGGVGRAAGTAAAGARGAAGGVGALAGSAAAATGALLGAGALVGGLVASSKAAIQWESDFAGVTKTVSGTPAQLHNLSLGFRQMATEIPASTTEIAAVGEAAGQLGIQTAHVEGFTRTMIDLGNTTNLQGDAAATALARLANITQMPQSEFDRLGSTVVHLGNNLATTESEIADFGLRVAGAGHQVGLSEAEILAFSGALSSVGIRAEAGGTAISRAMIEIDKAVADGADSVGEFARVSGMSAEAFIEQWETDPAGALVSFIEGLGRLEQSGENVFQVLDEMGLSEIRLRDALLRSAGAGDLLRESLELGTEAWEDNVALTEEAEKRYETTASKIEVAKNNFRDLGIEIGENLLPAVGAAADAFSNFIQGTMGKPPGADTPLSGRFWNELGENIAAMTGFDHLSGSADRAAESVQTLAGQTADADRMAAASEASFGMAEQGVAAYGDAAEMSEEQLEILAAQQEALGEAVAGFTDPLAIYTELLDSKKEKEKESATATADSTKSSKDSWKDYVSDVGVSLDEYADRLEEQVEQQEEWERNLVTVAGRAGTDVAQILAEMGEDGVELTADMANGTHAETSRMARLLRRDAESAQEDVVAALAAAMEESEKVVTKGGKAVVDGMGNELGLGVKKVARIVDDYAAALAAGLNPVILQVGGKTIVFRDAASARFAGRYGRAEGGIDFSFGGRPGAHITQQPQVLYGEPETGGEAYIPLGAHKRTRSRAIAVETVRRLGGVAEFADGGFTALSDVPGVPRGRTPSGGVGDTADSSMAHTRRATVEWLKKNMGGPALAWARTQAGKPYVWGGVGPGGYDCCLVGETVVPGPDGTRRIDDLQAGDRVWSWVDGDLQAHTVTAAWESATQQTYRVNARGVSVVGSANHPFLRVTQTRPFDNRRPQAEKAAQWDTEWVRLDQLQTDDLIVTLDEAPDIGGEHVDDDYAWLIGLIVGDGTITDKGARICVFGETRDRAQQVIRDRWGGAGGTHSDSGGLAVSNAAMRDALDALGLRLPGHEKRVPDAVWRWDRKAQAAFLNGYCDADGHRPADPKRHGDRTYASCSYDLIAGVRMLHALAGQQVTRISRRDRTEPIVIKGATVANARPLYTVTVWENGRSNNAGLRLHRGLRRFLDRGFGLRRVQSVTPEGVQRTYDIEVDGSHNFVADGVVVHNSGFLSAVTNVLQDMPPHHRRFTTASFAGGPVSGFKAGLGGRFQIGVFQGNPGHMAGTLSGTNVESSGGVGVRVGGGARGATSGMFTHRFHMARGGIVGGTWPVGDPPFDLLPQGVLPVNSFDQGGFLPPGLSVALNGTGAPEPVGPSLAGATIVIDAGLREPIRGEVKQVLYEDARAHRQTVRAGG